MKQSTYLQKLNDAMNDHRKLSEAAQSLTLVSLRTVEAKQVWRKLADAIDKLDAAIVRYRWMAGVEAKQAAAPAPSPTPPAPAVKLTRRQRIILEGLIRHERLYYPNLTNTLKAAAISLSGRKLITRNGNYLTITAVGRKALEGGQS